MPSNVRWDALIDQAYSPGQIQCRSLSEAEQHINSLTNRQEALEKRVRYMEDLFDTFFDSPLWMRLLFVIEGWPADRISSRPRRRFSRLVGK